MSVGSALVFPYTFLPIISAPPANQDVWISAILMFVYILIINAPILFLMNKFRGMTANEMTEAILGKVFGKAAALVFVLFFVFCFTACTLITSIFINLFIFPDTPMWAFLLFLTVPSCYASYKGAAASRKIANAFWAFASAGSLGGIFIHATICYLPIIYKAISEQGNEALAELAVNRLYEAVMIPFFALYLSLVAVPSVILIVAILRKQLRVPKWFVVMNPLVFLMVGVSFRLINPVVFADFPGIVMPSLGLGAIGVTVMVSARGNGG
jgi:hypothetical protein